MPSASDSGCQFEKVRNLVDEGDLGRQESVSGVFDELGGTQSDKENGYLIEAEWTIDLGYHFLVSGALVDGPTKRIFRMRHIAAVLIRWFAVRRQCTSAGFSGTLDTASVLQYLYIDRADVGVSTLHHKMTLFAVSTVVATLCCASASEASFFGLPWTLIIDEPTLAPIAHTRFCAQYPIDCELQKGDFRRRNITLSAERWHELTFVNRKVNRDITPEQKVGAILTARWLVSPKAGDCNDYAVTKRHMLLAHGWPSRSLLLAEVVTSWGEHHLVLVVRLSNVDVVLDNLDANVWPATITSYEWVRMESPHNPKFWSAVKVATTVSRITMLGN